VGDIKKDMISLAAALHVNLGIKTNTLSPIGRMDIRNMHALDLKYG
jgi:hypothetical protein